MIVPTTSGRPAFVWLGPMPLTRSATAMNLELVGVCVGGGSQNRDPLVAETAPRSLFFAGPNASSRPGSVPNDTKKWLPFFE